MKLKGRMKEKMPAKKTTSVKTKTTKKVAAPVKAAKVTAPAKKTDGLAVDLMDVKGKVIGTASLPKELFGAKVNEILMAQAVRVYLANQRKGTASTKSRGEVNASTRKIYRQKGTGRARHGAISAPIFVGGGIAFGPKPRDYSLTLSKQMKRGALASALSVRLKNKAVRVVDGLEKLTPKTKLMHEAFTKIIGDTQKKTPKILVVMPIKAENAKRAARNIAGVTIRPAALLNTYEVLNTDTLIFMKDSVEELSTLWNKQTS